MPRLRATVLCFLAGLALAAPQAAQAQDQVLRSPIVTVDQERLFRESAYGKAVLGRIEEETNALAAENRKIEAQLVAEEKALTEERATMDPAAFREKAAAFDDKVVKIRKEQDDKARALGNRRDDAQKTFFTKVLPILTDIVRERGAVAVLESRAIVLSADQIDITDAAIARIDKEMDLPEIPPSDQSGAAPDGAGPDGPTPAPEDGKT
ncbi:MAG: OmpH family outer membrane protein, partial [Paracoccaceae bacterium]